MLPLVKIRFIFPKEKSLNSLVKHTTGKLNSWALLNLNVYMLNKVIQHSSKGQNLPFPISVKKFNYQYYKYIYIIFKKHGKMTFLKLKMLFAYFK